MSTCIPQELKELLQKLEFLSLIQDNIKPNIYSMSFSEVGCWSHSLYRTATGESGTVLMKEINKIIDDAISALEQYNNTEFHDIILETLNRANTGLIKLRTTYKAKPDIVSKINVCMTNIGLQIKNIH